MFSIYWSNRPGYFESKIRRAEIKYVRRITAPPESHNPYLTFVRFVWMLAACVSAWWCRSACNVYAQTCFCCCFYSFAFNLANLFSIVIVAAPLRICNIVHIRYSPMPWFLCPFVSRGVVGRPTHIVRNIKCTEFVTIIIVIIIVNNWSHENDVTNRAKWNLCMNTVCLYLRVWGRARAS